MSAPVLNLKSFGRSQPKLTAPCLVGRISRRTGDDTTGDRSHWVLADCTAASSSKPFSKHFIELLQRILAPLGLATCITLAANSAWATAIAHSDLSFHDLAITPAAGTVQFAGPWLLLSQASADNSLSEFDSDYDETNGPATIGVGAAVTWASASGMATDPAPTSPYLDVLGSAVADGNIPGQTTGSAIAQGRGTDRHDSQDPPMGFFQILGGTAGNPVSVTFDVLIDYSLQAQTDPYGELAEAEVIFGQEIFGQDIGFVSVNGFNQVLSIGPNDFLQDSAVNQLLSNTIELQYGVVYTLLNETDAEIRVSNVPEPSALWMLTFGLLTLAVPLLARKNRRV